MGLFSWFGNWRKNRRRRNARSGSYGRVVAWVEARYGAINETDYSMDVLSKFEEAFEYGQKNRKYKQMAGLRRYIDKERYKDLLLEE